MNYYNGTELKTFEELQSLFEQQFQIQLATSADMAAHGWYPVTTVVNDVPASGQATGLTYALNSDGASYTATVTYITADQVAANQAAALAAMQLAKPLALKQLENTFLSLCDQLTGTTTHTPLTDSQIEAILLQMQATNANQANALASEFLDVDIQGIKLGGSNWFDTVAWHPEIVTTP